MKKKMVILTPILSVLIALVIVITVSGASVGTAMAKAPAPSHIRITIPMRIVSTKGVRGTPNVTGPCGDINISVSDLGNGDARFDEEVSSTEGFIYSLTYHVTWTNLSKDTSTGFGGVYVFPGNPWTHTGTQYTQPGLVSAVITAQDHVGGIPPFGTNCSGTASGADQIS